MFLEFIGRILRRIIRLDLFSLHLRRTFENIFEGDLQVWQGATIGDGEIRPADDEVVREISCGNREI